MVQGQSRAVVQCNVAVQLLCGLILVLSAAEMAVCLTVELVSLKQAVACQTEACMAGRAEGTQQLMSLFEVECPLRDVVGDGA